MGSNLQDVLPKFKGRVHVILRDKDGQIKYEEENNNLVVNAGKAWLAAVLAGETVNEIDHMAIGSGNTAAAGNQTQLGTELARVEVDDRERTGASVLITATFPAGTGTGTIQEAGLFDGLAGTTMFARYVFAGATAKAADDELEIRWTISQT